MAEKDANSPCRRIYLVIQLMYIDRTNIKTYHHTYWELVRELVSAAPSILKWVDEISTEKFWPTVIIKPSRLTQKLIQYEKEVLKSV